MDIDVNPTFDPAYQWKPSDFDDAQINNEEEETTQEAAMMEVEDETVWTGYKKYTGDTIARVAPPFLMDINPGEHSHDLYVLAGSPQYFRTIASIYSHTQQPSDTNSRLKIHHRSNIPMLLSPAFNDAAPSVDGITRAMLRCTCKRFNMLFQKMDGAPVKRLAPLVFGRFLTVGASIPWMILVDLHVNIVPDDISPELVYYASVSGQHMGMLTLISRLCLRATNRLVGEHYCSLVRTVVAGSVSSGNVYAAQEVLRKMVGMQGLSFRNKDEVIKCILSRPVVLETPGRADLHPYLKARTQPLDAGTIVEYVTSMDKLDETMETVRRQILWQLTAEAGCFITTKAISAEYAKSRLLSLVDLFRSEPTRNFCIDIMQNILVELRVRRNMCYLRTLLATGHFGDVKEFQIPIHKSSSWVVESPKTIPSERGVRKPRFAPKRTRLLKTELN